MNLKKILGIMREKGYTYESLAKELKVTTTCIFNKLHGKTDFRAKELLLLCKTLNLSKEDFMDIFFAQSV